MGWNYRSVHLRMRLALHRVPPPHRTPQKLGPDFPRFSRGYGKRDRDRRFGGSPHERTYTGLRASGDAPHSGTLAAATTSARAANPRLRSPNGRSTPVKLHAPERAPPSSASLGLPLANRKSRRVAAPPLLCLQLTNGDAGRFLSRPFAVSWAVGGWITAQEALDRRVALRMTLRLLRAASSHNTGSGH